MKRSKEEKGITLIALAVTIIVMLILAGITITTLIGEGGIINQAKKTRESSEIGKEKEQIKLAFQAQNIERFQYGSEITEENFKAALENVVGVDKNEVLDAGDEFEVKFLESERYYIVNKEDGTVELEIVENDEYAGDITKDIEGNILDGSEEHPYEINCIEDLVAFSIMTGDGNSSLNLNRNWFENKYIVLTRTLNFKSDTSYTDPTTTIYGDINTDGIVEDIKTELTKQGEECGGFPGIGKSTFKGNFDGRNNYIKNLYQNDKNQKDIGLFINIQNAEIENLSITGSITGKWHTAGIASGLILNSKLENCNNYANITGYNMVGGIFTYLRYSNSTITVSNCNNYGKISITGRAYGYGGAGGISASISDGKIENCTNNGIIENYSDNNNRDNNCGGIAGVMSNAIINGCINNAKCKNGIVGWIAGGENGKIINCYNLGECTNGIAGSFSGASWGSILKIDMQNCYNLGKCENSGILGEQGTVCASVTLNMQNCYNAGECPKSIIGKISKSNSTTTVTNIINTYYDKNKSESVGAISEGITELDEENIKNNEEFVNLLNNNIGENSELKRWIIGSNGYPTFE